MCIMDIVQHMWQTVDIPQELGWTVLVLVPKGTTDTWGIGLLDNLWKVLEALIDTHLRASPHSHGVLHGFQAEKGMGTAIIKPKLA